MIKKSFYLLITLLLTASPLASFAHQTEALVLAENAAQSKQVQSFVKVIEPLQSSVVRVSTVRKEIQASCFGAALDGVFSVQPAANLNLNQPAQCLSISLAPVAISQVLKVVTLASTTKVVVHTGSILTTYQIASSGSSPLLPALPVQSFVFVFALYILGAVSMVVYKQIIVVRKETLTLSLAELQVLRC